MSYKHILHTLLLTISFHSCLISLAAHEEEGPFVVGSLVDRMFEPVNEGSEEGTELIEVLKSGTVLDLKRTRVYRGRRNLFLKPILSEERIDGRYFPERIKLNDGTVVPVLHFLLKSNEKLSEMFAFLTKGLRCDPNIRDGKGQTFLHKFICNYNKPDKKDVLNSLLKLKTDPCARKIHHIGNYFSLWTPLHFAALNGDTEVLEVILNCDRVDVNAKSLLGKTPLHIAMSYEKENTVANIVALLAKGANPQAQDMERKTPYLLAKEQDNNKLIELFEKNLLSKN